MGTEPLADPVAEALRLISAAHGDRVRWYQEPEQEQEQAGGE